MPYLQHHDAHYPLASGETRVGQGTQADIRIPEGSAPGDHADASLAVIAIGADGAASLRVEQGDAGVFVNGVPVGREPAPLLHGDRVSIDGCELRFADELQSGDTQEIPTQDEVRAATPSAGIAEARSRGRIVSLTDGREYAVPLEGLVIGRDAGCDVVVVTPSVSRRHARITQVGGGYELTDTSSHGVFVNGARVRGQLALAKGDTLRVGADEFRFYADPEPPAPPRSLRETPSLQATAAIPAMKRPFNPLELPSPEPTVPRPTPPEPTAAGGASAAARGGPSGAAVPAVNATMAAATVATARPTKAPPGGPRASGAQGGPVTKSRPALATLEVLNEGASKGTRFELVAPLSHIGRGDHNDVVILDESVSESHAKIQRREDAWYIVDMDSTNGSYVAGTRVFGEAKVGSGVDLRVGGIKMAFRILGGGQRGTGETRVIVGVRGADPKRAEQHLKELARGVESREAPAERAGPPVWIWVALVALVAFFIYLVLQGR
ncbi:MAG: FHA domain-containing protein [Gemmatimonadota bacterium]